MREKGFTLIELLAVIVILAIIALIATPIILGIIKDAKKEADKRSVEMYYKALENAVAQQQLDGSKPITGTFYTDNGKEILLDKKTILTVKYDGPEISIGRIDIYEDGGIYLKDIKDQNDKILANSVGTKRYENGEVVYIDVTTGKSCTNYHEDNSKTGYNGINGTGNQTSCLKFYAFLDEGSKKLNLLLDHNTTAYSAWNSSDSDKTGPTEVIQKLYEDTKGWNGTITPLDYRYNGSSPYTIDYSEYKARLITAQEIAQITGADKVLNWKEESSIEFYYFHDCTQNSSTGSGDVCKAEGCKHGWLYDRTFNCTTYGCLNNPVGETGGYWTSTATTQSSGSAWPVSYQGFLHYSTNVTHEASFGVRPVITILKANI